VKLRKIMRGIISFGLMLYAVYLLSIYRSHLERAAHLPCLLSGILDRPSTMSLW